MSSATQNQINRLMKEIADLRKKEAQESTKEADLQAKINRAQEAISRTKSVSTKQSKSREIERAYKDLATVGKKRAEISRKIAEKSKSLQNFEEKKTREDERERKKIADAQKRLLREREQHERKFTSKLGYPVNIQDISVPVPIPPKEYDFFVSHASEDKDDFVRKLAETLRARGAKVWYDEFTLEVGDSLRREIDRGLANSRFGIVILSKHFFAKKWPQRELDGLCSLEVEGSTRILPIWHQISKDEVIQRSPVLADKIALNTSSFSTVDEIAVRLYKMTGNTIDEIEETKKSFGNGNGSHATPNTKSNVINFPGTNRGQVANKIENKTEIKIENKTVKLNPPPGSIASSIEHRNYTKYLIDRYHELQESDIGRENMKYPILYKSIQRKFGAKWDMIPLQKFDELSAYLQDRIDKTKIGRIKKANNQKTYSTFEEYCDKYYK